MAVVGELVNLGPTEGQSGVRPCSAFIVEAVRYGVVSIDGPSACSAPLNRKEHSFITLRPSNIETADIGNVCRRLWTHKTQAPPLLGVCSCRARRSCRLENEPLGCADSIDWSSW